MRLKPNQYQKGLLATICSVALFGWLAVCCDAQSRQPSLYGDPHVEEWSQPSLDRKFDQALASIERDLLSPDSHPH